MKREVVGPPRARRQLLFLRLPRGAQAGRGHFLGGAPEEGMSQSRPFRVVAETLTFTRAAGRLNLTRAAVSHQIRALEQELGEPLFIRAPRGVQLSPAGRGVLEYAARILDDAAAMRDSLGGRGTRRLRTRRGGLKNRGDQTEVQ